MIRSAIIVRVATTLGVLGAGQGPELLKRYRSEGNGQPFEEWGEGAGAWGNDATTQIRDAYHQQGFRCTDCASMFPAAEFSAEHLECPVCGGTNFDVSPEFNPKKPATNEQVLLELGSNEARTPASHDSKPGSGGLSTTSNTPGVTPPSVDASIAMDMPAGGMGEVIDLRRPLEEGQIIGNVEITGRIGEGGMGTVYKARHRTLGRMVAVKVITPDRLTSPEALKRFRREARTMAAFDHPHIVQVYDFGEIGGGAYFTMQFIDGQSLADRIKREGKLPIDEVLKIFAAVAKALDAAHKENIIHRDLKPDNVLLTKDGQIKLADFGLAKADMGPDMAGLTRPDVVLGTPLYMAPEQVEGQVGPQADLYALGCTMYHALVGKPPFRAKGVWNLLRLHAESPMPSLRDDLPDAPPELDKLLQHVCAKRPDERPETAGQVLEAIEKIQGKGQPGMVMMAGPAVDTTTPIPLARARRDFKVRQGTSQTLVSATNYFNTFVQVLVATATAPLFRGQITPAMAQAINPIGAPKRTTGWVTALRNLLRLHQELNTPGEPITALQVFSRTKRNGPALQKLFAKLQSLGGRFEPLRPRLEKLALPISFAGWSSAVAVVLDALQTATTGTDTLEFAEALGEALDELTTEAPTMPSITPVWVELVDELPNGHFRLQVQKLLGEFPASAATIDAAPDSAEMRALGQERDQGLFLQVSGQLLTMEPLVLWDDGEWYAFTGCDAAGAEYRCTTTNHRLFIPREGASPQLAQLFPQGVQNLPLPQISVNSTDLNADLSKFPGDIGGMIAQAARSIKTEPDRSLELSMTAAAQACGLVLRQPTIKLDTAVELLKNASPPIVPTAVESMADLARRAPYLGPDGVPLALYAAVRLGAWVAGTISAILNFNAIECLKTLAGAEQEEEAVGQGGYQPTLRRGNRLGNRGEAEQFQLQGLPTLGRKPNMPPPPSTPVGVRCLGPVMPTGSITVPTPASFGRNPDSTVQIQSAYVSRHHATLLRTGRGEVVVVHEAPTNGSAVNGCKATTLDLHPLRPGDLFILDTEVFMVEL